MIFPTKLELGNKLSLVGLGVRTVSFLRVKVYSAAFYVEDRVLDTLAKLPGWSAFSAEQIGNDTLISALLQASDCAIRIGTSGLPYSQLIAVPVRGTDLAHLRDGWVRAIQARQKLARKSASITTEQDEDVTQAVQTLKALFPARSVPKGSALILERSKNGELRILVDGELLGTMRHEWMSRELFAAYFADENTISAKVSPRDMRYMGVQRRLRGS